MYIYTYIDINGYSSSRSFIKRFSFSSWGSQVGEDGIPFCFSFYGQGFRKGQGRRCLRVQGRICFQIRVQGSSRVQGRLCLQGSTGCRLCRRRRRRLCLCRRRQGQGTCLITHAHAHSHSHAHSHINHLVK